MYVYILDYHTEQERQPGSNSREKKMKDNNEIDEESAANDHMWQVKYGLL